MWGNWLVVHSVCCAVAQSYSPTAARGSIGLPTSRLLTSLPRAMRRLLHRNAALSGHAPPTRNGADAVALEIVAGKHCHNARHGERRRKLNSLDPRMRVG